MSSRRVPPNVLLIIADDHQSEAIGALGHPCVHTPVLDSLVRRGTAFTRAGIMGALTPAVCAPARACLLTGRHVFAADAAPALNRGPRLEVTIVPAAPTLPELFRVAGYETFFTGKWHNDAPALLRSFSAARRIFHGGKSDHQRVPVRDLEEFARGAEPVIGQGFSSDLFADAAVEFIRERKRSRPFFACVALTSPHDPRMPPAAFRALYEPANMPLPPNFRPEHPFDNGELESRDEMLAPPPRHPSEVRRHLADYYGMISHHDAALGRVMEALRAAGEWERTIVIYTSDHGLALGAHGLLGKQNLYEHSVRVPLIFAGPGVRAGATYAGLVYSLDVFATVCELGGIKPPADVESRSLVAALSGKRQRGREYLCAVYMDCQRMIVERRWKLIRYCVNRTEQVQLFDLEHDPHELRNLAADPTVAAHRDRLRTRLSEWQQASGDRWMPDPLAAKPARIGVTTGSEPGQIAAGSEQRTSGGS